MTMIDPSIFGGTVREDLVIDPAPTGVNPPATPEIKAPTNGLYEGHLQQRAVASQDYAQRERATAIEAFGAGLVSTDTARAVRSLFTQRAEPEAGFNYKVGRETIPFVPTEDEEDYFREAVSYADLNDRVEVVRKQREAQEAMGDSPVAGFLGLVVDPVYAATGLAALRIGRLAATAGKGRVLAGASDAALNVGVMAAGEGPRSEAEYILGAAASFAAGAMVYKPGKGAVPADPLYPAPTLQAVVDTVERRLVSEAVYEDITIPGTPAVTERVVIPGTPAVTEFVADLPAAVRGAKPRYGYKQDNFPLTFSNDLDKAAYILAGKGKSKAHAEILDWAMRVSGKTEQELLDAGTSIRESLKQRLSDTGEGTAFGRDALDVPRVLDYKPRGRVVEKSPAVPERIEERVITPAVPARTERRLVREAVYGDYPTVPKQTIDTVEDAIDEYTNADPATTGQWSLRRTLAGFGPVGKEVSDLLFHPGKPSVDSHRVAVRADFVRKQKVYEDLLQQAMAQDGFGLLKRITPWRSVEASKAQAKLEDAVRLEMHRREQLTRQGRPISYDGVEPRVKAMADALDEVHALARKEMQAAGVEGAEALEAMPGWLHRKWSASKVHEMEQAIVRTGKTAEEAHREVVRLVALSLRKANGWDDMLAYDIGAAIINRAKRKGYFEDALFNASEGAGTMKQLRDILSEEGLSGQRLERALEVLRQQSDEAGKAGFMKHRVDLDYRAAKAVGDQTFRVIDLIDNRVTHLVDQYLDGVSTQVAFARMGLKKRSDIEALRTRFAHSLNPGSKQMEEGVRLFDQSFARMEGRPLGDPMPEFLRLTGMYGRMIALANSGLWQLTEYATAMAEYGVLRTTKHMLKEMPLARKLFDDLRADKATAGSLHRVLSEHSQNNLRLRPFMYRYEDNVELDAASGLHLAAQQAQQLVPYANVMKWIHGHQARVVANLIVERLQQAARGDKAAIAGLQKYGIGRQVMERLRRELPTKGANVDNWSDGLWEAVRPAFANMMDEAVLHSRMGDMPAFAQFDNLGKFLFMYRSFMLTAHNRLLVGRLHRDGPGAVGLLMLYQFPLAFMAVQAQAVMSGKGPMTEEDAAKRALGVMGGLGAGTELTNIAFGFNNQITTPGYIPFDRALRLALSVAEGDPNEIAKNGVATLPILGIMQPVRSFTALATDEE